MVSKNVGVQRYIYWSERRVRSLLDDQGIRIIEKRQRKISTPNIRGFLPTGEWAQETPSLTKPELAARLERAIESDCVTDLNSPAPIRFAKGIGTTVFGEFAGVDDKPTHALIYTTCPSETGANVGVCLFGSVENYAEFAVAADAQRTGWTSSAAHSIYRFLLEECKVTSSRWETKEMMAREAIKVTTRQGESGLFPIETQRNPWNRGYTYGDTLDKGEWCAEIFLDVDLSKTASGPQEGHDRVLVGAPLWLRTPTPTAIRLYSDYDPKTLDHNKNYQEYQ
jgi:hypothetical protein